MNIHEYQAKEVLAKFGVPVPAGFAALTVEEAVDRMELVGHDFYLFVNEETNRPAVVYRRHAYDYGLIALSADAADAKEAEK